MKTSIFLYLVAFTLFLSSCKNKDKEDVQPATDATFTYSFSNNGVAPCTLFLKAVNENTYYSWKFKNSFLSNSKETSVEIKEEGFFPVELTVANGSTSASKKDTITVYAEEYSKSIKLPKDSVSCKSFRYKNQTFTFNDPDHDGIDFDNIPNFFPDVLGDTLYKMSADIDKKIRNTSFGDIEKGSSIIDFDVTLQTEKLDIHEKMKLYVFYNHDCLDSVKVYDYSK